MLQEHHGLLDRPHFLLEACELNSVSEEDYIDLVKAGLVSFINFERTKLPSEILRHNIEEKKDILLIYTWRLKRVMLKFRCLRIQILMQGSPTCSLIATDRGCVQSEASEFGSYYRQVKYVMRCVFSDPKEAPPPLERLSPEAAASYIWKGYGSFVEELIECMTPHTEDVALWELKAQIHAHDPSCSNDRDEASEIFIMHLSKWLRDEVRNLPCSYRSCHDAAADLIHIYAYTKYFLGIRIVHHSTVGGC
ncbi:hypothetical protein OROMI_026400 [Orobanche minor]